MVVITPKGVTIKNSEGRVVNREPQRITWSLEDAEKGGFEHFMLKEIHEAPQAIHETLLGRLANLEVDGFLSEGVTSVKLVACGTSYHAALVGKYVIEEIARIPASAELASEYRYSQGATERPLVLLLSQSGETADTLGAAREAHRRGCKTLAICNVIGSSLSREVDKTIYTRAGIEIGVAATKTFIAQLVVLYLIALKLGQDRGTLGYDELDRLKDQLRSLPRAAQYVLNKADEIRALAEKYGRDTKDMFYIGRPANYPVAMEGALKIKETSYIHADAYAAGELKHGPRALLTSSPPVIAIVAQDPTYESMRSNRGEWRARHSLDSAESRDELLKPGCRSFRDEDLKAIRFVDVGVKHRADFVEAVLEHRQVRARIPPLVDDREDDGGFSVLSAPFRDIDEFPQRLADRFAPAAVPAPLGDVVEAPED